MYRLKQFTSNDNISFIFMTQENSIVRFYIIASVRLLLDA